MKKYRLRTYYERTNGEHKKGDIQCELLFDSPEDVDELYFALQAYRYYGNNPNEVLLVSDYTSLEKYNAANGFYEEVKIEV